MKPIGTRILIAFSAILFTSWAFGQQVVITPGSPEYDSLKAAGQLPQNIGFFQGDGSQAPVFAITPPPEKSVTQCNCMLPIDNTYQVAAFTNGSPPQYRNDDGSTNAIALPFTFCLYNDQYNTIYINNNGNVTFTGPEFTFSSTGFPSSSYVMVAPFWADVDTRNLNSGIVYYKITPTHVIVRWKDVGYYSSQADKKNDFQLILTNSADTIIPIGTNVSFCYGDMQWTTGSASGGSGGFGGTAATVGSNRGNGTTYAQFGRFNQAGIAYDGPFGANDGISWLDNQSFFFNTCTSNNNLAPIATGMNFCDTISTGVCVGDVINFNFSFLSPENNQTTSTVINPTGVPNFTGTATTGNISVVTATFAPTIVNLGYNTLTFVGTDNGSPPASTIIDIVVYVTPPPQPPVITGDSTICPGGSTTLYSTPGFMSYLWSPNGEVTSDITVNQAGTYIVSADSGGCAATDTFRVYLLPPPTPTILGPLANCITGLSTIWSDFTYASYLWTPGNYATDSIDVPLGNYTLTVTDTNGCTGTANIVVNQVLQIAASLLQSANASCVGLCDGSASIDVQNSQGTVNYAWSPAAPNQAVNQGLCAGPYDVIVADNSGCADTVSFVIGSNSLITTQVTSVDLNCFNICNGQISINPLQGQQPFTYNWTPNVANAGSSNTLCAGTYIIESIDNFGCIATDTVTLTQPSEFRVIAGSTPETCPGICDGTITATLSGGVSPYGLVWTPGNSTDSSLVGMCGGQYSYIATDANGCVDNGSLIVPTIPAPVAAFSSNAAQADVLEPTVDFFDESSTDVIDWQWDFSSLDSSAAQNPSYFFPGVGDYPITLIVTNNYGCTDTTMSVITIADVETMYIPNSFTPNHDGRNEVFLPLGHLGANVDYEMTIFDRWGNAIFTTIDINVGWDGTLRGRSTDEKYLLDVYIYKIVLTNKKNDRRTVYTGHVSLVK